MHITDSPFYRVTAKAIIFDSEDSLLLLKNHEGNWEIPGGGWEHDESFEDCLRRELREELGVAVETIGGIVCSYRGVSKRYGFHTLRLVAPVTLKSYDIQGGEDTASYAFVSRDEFLALDLAAAEGDVMGVVDQFWPTAA